MGFLDSLKQLFSSKPKAKGGGELLVANIDKRFDLIGRTGQGSMSKVWRAHDKKLGRVVCLKILDKEKTKKFDARFPGLKRPNEGAILAILKHKNIVQCFEHGMTTKGEQYVVMELIDGMGFNFLVETRGPQLEKNRIDLLAQFAEGLEFIHKHGFLHRDVCPRNAMVNKEGVVKIIDFGLSIPYKPDFCKPGNRTGTPTHLAPELIKRQSTDHRVDMFALGVTAYEVFTGNLPWEKAESMQTLLSHVNSPPRDPREFAPNLHRKIVDFLLKSVERDPRDRFQTAAEFREALRALQGL